MNVFVANEQLHPVDVGTLRSLAERVLEEERCPPDSEVSLIFVDDEDMAGYNRRFLGREGPTDVISLPIEDLAPGRPPSVVVAGPPPLLGDVIIDPSYVWRRAGGTPDAFAAELALMVVHGLLHLLGYGHESDEDAERMESRERELLARAGMAS